MLQVQAVYVLELMYAALHADVYMVKVCGEACIACRQHVRLPRQQKCQSGLSPSLFPKQCEPPRF